MHANLSCFLLMMQ